MNKEVDIQVVDKMMNTNSGIDFNKPIPITRIEVSDDIDIIRIKKGKKNTSIYGEIGSNRNNKRRNF